MIGIFAKTGGTDKLEELFLYLLLHTVLALRMYSGVLCSH